MSKMSELFDGVAFGYSGAAFTAARSLHRMKSQGWLLRWWFRLEIALYELAIRYYANCVIQTREDAQEF